MKSKFNELYNKIIMEMQYSKYRPSPPDEYWSEDDKVNLDDYQYAEYFKLADEYEVIKNGQKIGLIIYFKGKAKQVIDDDDNAQICEIIPDLSQIYVYDENDMNYTDKLTAEEKQKIQQFVKDKCEYLSNEVVCQDSSPQNYIQPVMQVDFKDNKFNIQDLRQEEEAYNFQNALTSNWYKSQQRKNIVKQEEEEMKAGRLLHTQINNWAESQGQYISEKGNLSNRVSSLNSKIKALQIQLQGNRDPQKAKEIQEQIDNYQKTIETLRKKIDKLEFDIKWLDNKLSEMRQKYESEYQPIQKKYKALMEQEFQKFKIQFKKQYDLNRVR